MFIRISYMHPKAGSEGRVSEILKDLSAFYHAQTAVRKNQAVVVGAVANQMQDALGCHWDGSDHPTRM